LAYGKHLIKIEIKPKNEEKYFGFTDEIKDIEFSYYIREGGAIMSVKPIRLNEEFTKIIDDQVILYFKEGKCIVFENIRDFFKTIGRG
jgi:hypothetical protein